jgi:hypothetical protein
MWDIVRCNRSFPVVIPWAVDWKLVEMPVLLNQISQ